jgi:SAM-dependent methyltransferase
MGVVMRVVLYGSGVLKRYGPSSLKKFFWDREFARGKWNFADDTSRDPVYLHLEKYVGPGSVLDLGCGQGGTAVELTSSYQRYVGVDISEVALNRARKKVADVGRTSRASFACSDFLGYEPDQKFDVILFRESMYHVPLGKVKIILDRYTQFLTEEGVFIVRIGIHGPKGEKRFRPGAVVRSIEAEFDIVDKVENDRGLVILVFRPRVSAGNNELRSAGHAAARI